MSRGHGRDPGTDQRLDEPSERRRKQLIFLSCTVICHVVSLCLICAVAMQFMMALLLFFLPLRRVAHDVMYPEEIDTIMEGDVEDMERLEAEIKVRCRKP